MAPSRERYRESVTLSIQAVVVAAASYWTHNWGRLLVGRRRSLLLLRESDAGEHEY